MNVQHVTLDLSKERDLSQVVTLGQGDKAGTTIVAHVFDARESVTLTGMTARFEMSIQGKRTYFRSGDDLTVSGNTITYVVDEEHAAATSGRGEGYFSILSGSTVVYSTARFSVVVLPSASEGASLNRAWTNGIDEALVEVTEAIDAANQAVEDVADAVEDVATAVSAAEQAVTDAQSAVSSANTAVSNANTAIANTNAATTAAQGATTDALSATTAATQAATAANTAASTANTAAANAGSAATTMVNQVNAAITRADNAADTATYAASDAEQRINAAIAACGDVSQLAVPLMSSDIRGGAKLGDGLAVDDGTLHVGQLAKASTGEVYGPLASVTAKGHAEQASTTGKNLLPSTATSQTKNGVTFTANADGSISISGTASAFTEFRINATAIVPADGTYTLSGAHSNNCYLRAWGNNSNSVIIDDFGDGASFSFSAATQVNITAFINVRTNAAVNDVIYPMIEAGSSKTEYEPYTGGAPSPSPDYPQEIQVVRGRNLLPNNATSRTINGVTFTVNADGSITFNGTATAKVVYPIFSGSISAGTYVVSDSQPTNHIARIEITTSGLYYNTSSGQKTFTVEADASYSAYVVVWPNETANGTIYPQLERGSVAHSYVPYGDYVGLEAQGKNLLVGLATFSHGGIASTLQSDGSMIVNGTASGITVCKILNDKPLDIKLGNTYTLGMGNAIAGVRYEMYGANDTSSTSNFVLIASIASNGKLVTFTANAEYKYYRLNLLVTSGTSVSNNTIYPQLELGSTATTYEPYFHYTTPIPLPSRGWVASLPDGTCDTLALDGAGKVVWSKATDEWVLNGSSSESWSISRTGTPNWYYLLQRSGHMVGAPILCDRYVYTNVSNSNTVQGIATVTNALRIRYGTEDTVENYKTWLSTHPVTILYPLATPVTEECGYVDNWPIEIAGEATVTCPELEELGVTFWVDGDGLIVASMRKWYERAHSEYEDRLVALESAVAEIIAGA